MLTQILKDTAIIERKLEASHALGQDVAWQNVGTFYCRLVPVDTEGRIAYQQYAGRYIGRFIFRGTPELSLNHRILHKGDIYIPIDPPQDIECGSMIVVRRE
jgi:hypothetical protein